MNEQQMVPFAIASASALVMMALWIHSKFENRDLQNRVDNADRNTSEANHRWREQNQYLDTNLKRVIELLDKEEEDKS